MQNRCPTLVTYLPSHCECNYNPFTILFIILIWVPKTEHPLSPEKIVCMTPIVC